MSLVVFHRTSIAHARSIMQNGFEDRQWDLGFLENDGVSVPLIGIWLSGRPLEVSDGVEGDAQLEITLDATDEEIEPFELEGLVWDARFWVAPSEFLNQRTKVRILEVDPRTSWSDKVRGDEE